MSTEKIHRLCIAALLALVTAIAFAPVVGHEFLAYDDPLYVTDNPIVTRGLTFEGLKWAITEFHSANWHPLTWLSHMFDCQFFGLNPSGHHVSNVLFHVANTLLLYWVLLLLTGRSYASAAVSIFFAVHPMHVESVAWIAERKDVLCMFFTLLTIRAYIAYVEKPNSRYRILLIIMYALSLMAKPTAVTTPFILLLLDYWPLDRIRFDSGGDNHRQSTALLKTAVFEKIPLFALAAIEAIIAIASQRSGGAVQSLESLDIYLRVKNAVVSYCSYLSSLFWPNGLCVYYPHPLDALHAGKVLLAGLLLVAITTIVIWGTVRLKRRYLSVGWFWFLITLLPMIGLVQIGMQALADRYSYFSFTGIFIIIVWGFSDVTNQLRHKHAVRVSGLILVTITLAALTWKQVGYWHDTKTLLMRALSVTEKNFIMQYNLAHLLAEEGKTDEAKHLYREAISSNPVHEDAHNNLGRLLEQEGDFEGAIFHYRKALESAPHRVRTIKNMALALAKRGDHAAAEQQFRLALVHVDNALDESEIHYNLGITAMHQGNTQKEAEHFRGAVQARPDYFDAQLNLGAALYSLGALEEAIHHFRQACRLRPDSAMASNNLEQALHHRTQ
jgi:Tfp pilus assembly protein PilF